MIWGAEGGFFFVNEDGTAPNEIQTRAYNPMREQDFERLRFAHRDRYNARPRV